MVLDVIVLACIISKIFLAWMQLYVHNFAFDLICDPKKSHFHGSGTLFLDRHVLLYPLDIVLTHPRRALGFAARGSTRGELSSCMYHGHTS